MGGLIRAGQQESGSPDVCPVDTYLAEKVLKVFKYEVCSSTLLFNFHNPFENRYSIYPL